MIEDIQTLLAQPWVPDVLIFAGALGVVFLLFFTLMANAHDRRVALRLKRLQMRKRGGGGGEKAVSMGNLRRKTQDNSMPMLGQFIRMLPNLEKLRDRLDRASITMSAERYILINLGILSFVMLVIVALLGKPLMLGLMVGIIFGAGIPHFVVNFIAAKRMKRFLTLFPDAIDLIVRGLRSGLPVTEGFNVVGTEVEDPVGKVFRDMGESIRLGKTVEKSLTDMARRMQNTEFNFFVTSIILQRETGGNLGEILNNLSEVLRKRFMMRMKIKALSSEAKASAIIVGALPFVVIGVLFVLSPRYLDPLFYDYRGNIAGLGALTSMGLGIGIMIKMTKFEI